MSKPSPSHPVVVLGAGVCGLYAGLVLSRAGKAVTLIEEQAVPGGLATAIKQGENYYDLGVHMLHAFDQDIFENVAHIMGKERHEVALDAQISWAGKQFRYPLKLKDIVSGMRSLTLARCLFGLIVAGLTQRRAKEPLDAEEALIQLYGRPLYEFFFRDFTTRYWGFPPNQLSATFVKDKMPRLSAFDVIRNGLARLGLKTAARSDVEGALREETLHYSKTGAETLPRKLAEKIIELRGQIIYAAEVVGVETDPDRQVTSVSWRDKGSGSVTQQACAACISTIPLSRLLPIFQPVVPEPIKLAAQRLRYKPIVIYGLLVNKPKCLDALYVYYRDRLFHRVGEPKNAGLAVTPSDHTILIVEMTCEKHDARWQGREEVGRQLLSELQADDICQADEVVEQHIFTSPYAYPILGLGFESDLTLVKDYLSQFENLRSTGRQGRFAYPNMHGAMRMGMEAAQVLMPRLN